MRDFFAHFSHVILLTDLLCRTSLISVSKSMSLCGQTIQSLTSRPVSQWDMVDFSNFRTDLVRLALQVSRDESVGEVCDVTVT